MLQGQFRSTIHTAGSKIKERAAHANAKRYQRTKRLLNTKPVIYVFRGY
jgi:RNA-splicing ligase RtcB